MSSEEALDTRAKCQEIDNHGNSVLKPKSLLATVVALDQFLRCQEEKRYSPWLS